MRDRSFLTIKKDGCGEFWSSLPGGCRCLVAEELVASPAKGDAADDEEEGEQRR